VKECDGKLHVGFPTGSQSLVMSMGETCITHSVIGNLFLQMGSGLSNAVAGKATLTSSISMLDRNASLEDNDDDEEIQYNSEKEAMANFHYATPLSCATYAEAIDCAMLVNYAGTLRWMKESLTEPDDLVKTKIRPLEVWQLPVGMCNHPHSMTSRLLDVNILPFPPRKDFLTGTEKMSTVLTFASSTRSA
jgi:hypothetical protein